MTALIKSGGALIVDALEAHGVKQLFCVPGESYLEVLDALHAALLSPLALAKKAVLL